MTDQGPARIKGTDALTELSADGHLDSAELFRRFAPFVASFLLRHGVPRVDLDDVIQDVFLVAHKLGGYTPGPAKPTTYLANIALRAATTHRRKGKTRGFVRPNEELVGRAAGGSPDPERSRIDQERLAILQRVLETLDDDKRAIFVMAEIHGETVVSIAAGLGIPVDTAYSRLRAARKLFREAASRITESGLHDAAPALQRAQP